MMRVPCDADLVFHQAFSQLGQVLRGLGWRRRLHGIHHYVFLYKSTFGTGMRSMSQPKQIKSSCWLSFLTLYFLLVCCWFRHFFGNTADSWTRKTKCYNFHLLQKPTSGNVLTLITAKRPAHTSQGDAVKFNSLFAPQLKQPFAMLVLKRQRRRDLTHRGDPAPPW